MKILFLLFLIQAPGQNVHFSLTSRQIYILHEIQSTHDATMQKGLDQLKHNPGMLKKPHVMTELTKILNKNTKALNEARAKNIMFHHEDQFCIRYEQIIIILFKYGNLNDPYLYKSLLHSGYDPSSKMAYMLAGQGGRGFKYILQLYHENQGKARAIGVASNMLLRNKLHNLKYPLIKRQIQALKTMMHN